MTGDARVTGIAQRPTMVETPARSLRRGGRCRLAADLSRGALDLDAQQDEVLGQRSLRHLYTLALRVLREPARAGLGKVRLIAPYRRTGSTACVDDGVVARHLRPGEPPPPWCAFRSETYPPSPPRQVLLRRPAVWAVWPSRYVWLRRHALDQRDRRATASAASRSQWNMRLSAACPRHRVNGSVKESTFRSASSAADAVDEARFGARWCSGVVVQFARHDRRCRRRYVLGALGWECCCEVDRADSRAVASLFYMERHARGGKPALNGGASGLPQVAPRRQRRSEVRRTQGQGREPRLPTLPVRSTATRQRRRGRQAVGCAHVPSPAHDEPGRHSPLPPSGALPEASGQQGHPLRLREGPEAQAV